MALTLPKRVAMRTEHTGTAPGDRAQRMAQVVGQAHEQTKSVVAALANLAYAELSTDQSLAGSAGVFSPLLSVNIVTTLASGSLLVTFTASSAQITNAGNTYFRLVVDGVVRRGTRGQVAAGFGLNSAIVQRIPVTRGTHTVAVQWSADNNTARINAKSLSYEHANLVVQEAA